MIERRQVSAGPLFADWTASWCSWIPNVLNDPLVAVRIAEEAVAADGNNLWSQKALGLALYRAGKIEESIEHLDRSVELDPVGGHVTAWLLLAMAHHKAGHRDQARARLEQAREWVIEHASELDIPRTKRESAEHLPSDQRSGRKLAATGQPAGPPTFWPDRTTIKYLFLEAVSLIGDAEN